MDETQAAVSGRTESGWADIAIRLALAAPVDERAADAAETKIADEAQTLAGLYDMVVALYRTRIVLLEHVTPEFRARVTGVGLTGVRELHGEIQHRRGPRCGSRASAYDGRDRKVLIASFDTRRAPVDSRRDCARSMRSLPSHAMQVVGSEFIQTWTQVS